MGGVLQVPAVKEAFEPLGSAVLCSLKQVYTLSLLRRTRLTHTYHVPDESPYTRSAYLSDCDGSSDPTVQFSFLHAWRKQLVVATTGYFCEKHRYRLTQIIMQVLVRFDWYRRQL